ncbi:hypothetical protein DSO57_1008200 [Entomophthora muscae]|uniref:Uncharacterized protein n=1 Tax=Entomophthora muscae TaxID=34485 RepID=A0ACC2SVZ8_9FUNG|nr:hypothetical protein DSO57_1008200 [Entomophthora muscae]
MEDGIVSVKAPISAPKDVHLKLLNGGKGTPDIGLMNLRSTLVANQDSPQKEADLQAVPGNDTQEQKGCDTLLIKSANKSQPYACAICRPQMWASFSPKLTFPDLVSPDQ